jgi:hypothetical protein
MTTSQLLTKLDEVLLNKPTVSPLDTILINPIVAQERSIFSSSDLATMVVDLPALKSIIFEQITLHKSENQSYLRDSNGESVRFGNEVPEA